MVFEIDEVIKEIKEKKPNGFINECHFQLEFARAIKKKYSDSKIELEKNIDRKRMDLYVMLEDNNIGFEFKYYTKTGKITIQDFGEITLKNQIAKDVARIGFWKDIKRMEYFVDKEIISFGYCIIMSNDEKLFEKTKDKNNDRDFDISNGCHTHNRRRYMGESNNTDITVNGDYDFLIKKYNEKKMKILVVKVPSK